MHGGGRGQTYPGEAGARHLLRALELPGLGSPTLLPPNPSTEPAHQEAGSSGAQLCLCVHPRLSAPAGPQQGQWARKLLGTSSVLPEDRPQLVAGL